MNYRSDSPPDKQHSFKKIGLTFLSLGVFAFVALSAITIHGGMPTNLRVLACPQRFEFYAPKCKSNCPEQVIEMTASDAFSKGFRPSDDCLKAGWFDEYDISLLRELLDKIGLIPAHPWNRDGTWRTSAFSAPLRSRVPVPTVEAIVEKTVREFRPDHPPLSSEEQATIAEVSRRALDGDKMSSSDLEKVRLAVKSYVARTGNKPNVLDWWAFSRVSKSVFVHNQELGRCLRDSLNSRNPVISEELRKAAIELEELTGKRGVLAKDIQRLESVAYQRPWTDTDGKVYAPVTEKEITLWLERARQQKHNFDKIEITMREAAQ